MSGITRIGKSALSSVIGTGKTSAAGIDINRTFSTPFSSVSGGRLNLDPTIRGIQDETLTGLRNLRGTGDIFRGLSQEFAGNEGRLRNARLNPLRANIASGRGRLSRELGRTGVRGTFANQARTNFDLDSGRALGDAEALAEQDALQTQVNLEDLAFQRDASIEQLIGDVGQERFQQELQGLGLSSNTINSLLSLSLNRAGLQDQASENRINRIGNLLNAGGKALMGAG